MKGPIEALRAMIAADPDGPGPSGAPKHRPEHYDFYIANNLAKWEANRKIVGNGQCAVFVQVASGAPLTGYWVRGPRVKGNLKVPKGTVIALFTEGGFYSTSKAEPRHAAIYLGQDKKALMVLDQWEGRNVASGFDRPLVFGKRKDIISVNDGDNFHVVLTTKFTDWDWAAAAAGG